MTYPDDMIIVFADAETETVGVLRAALAYNEEPYAVGVSVGNVIPSDRTIDNPQLPYVQVQLDGVPVAEYPVAIRPTVRVTAWHDNQDHALELAVFCQSVLLAASTDTVQLYTWLTGPFRGTDPVTEMAVSSFTIRATVRGSLVSPQ
ncbi:MAG: hypothetical protein J2P17_16865 [Mycobacterium sp.]|nr:hypothetical protein [Mycobacterium sp.]